MFKFTVSVDYESESFTYYDDDYAGTLPLLDDLTTELYASDTFRADWKEGAGRELIGFTDEETDQPYYDFCRAAAEDAISEAERTGSAHVDALTIQAIDDADPAAFAWYYHDQDAGEYHAIRRQGKPRHGYRVALEIDPATGDPNTYTGLLKSKAEAVRVLSHLAPAAVLLPGLPAWLR